MSPTPARRLSSLGGLLLLLLLPLPLAALEPGRPSRPMSDCLDPSQARGWQVLDADELLVDAGRRRFHLQLMHACPELEHDEAIVFRAGNGIGRLCGGPGDSLAVAPRGWRPTRCTIARVTRIDRARYDALLRAAPGGVRADASTPRGEPRR